MTSLAALVEEGELEAARTWVIDLWRRKPYAKLAALLSEIDAASGKPRTRSLDGVFVTGNTVASRERLVERIPTLVPEPATFEWIVEELGRPRFDVASGNPRRLYELIVDELAKLQDERVVPWVAGLPAFMQARKGRRFGQLSPDEITALTEIFAARKFRAPYLEALTTEEEAELAAVRKPLDALQSRAGTQTAQRASLFERVCADFEDDVPKEVFADFLLEENDPLGEYIVLSLKLAREGELPPEQASRQRSLAEHAKRFQPMGKRFERGFAVEARFTDGEGTRRGSWGLEPEWGTIAICDVPPTSDDCHTQSLRELELGSTFIADLAKLRKPLAVTTLTWRQPSPAGRPKWRKVKVLPALEKLAVIGPLGGDTLEFLLLEGPGITVRELTIEGWHWGFHIEWVAAISGKKGARLTSTRLGKNAVLTRANERTKLALTIPDAPTLLELERELANAPRPLVDEVSIDGPGDANTYANLITLGRESRLTLTASPAANAATSTRTGDTLTIVPSPLHRVFDVPALNAFLRANETARRIVIASSAQIAEAGAYYRVARDVGATELTLTGPWRSSRITLTAMPEGLDVEVGRADLVVLLREVIASFGGRVKKLVLRHALNLPDFERAMSPLRDVTDVLELVPEPRILAAMYTYSESKGRASIDPAGTSILLLPSTAEVILEGKRRPKELRVGQNKFVLEAWIEWVKETKIAVTFAHDWRGSILGKVSWNDGIVARLLVDGYWPQLVKTLANVPDHAIKELDLRSSIAPTDEAKAACRRAALKHTIAS